MEPALSDRFAPQPIDLTTEALEAGLTTLGYAAFRSGQEAAIRTLLGEGRLLLVAPTGGGKSLSYQLPATLLPGTTLVVSPLVSLMHDQVSALAERGVRATYLAATLAPVEMRERLGRVGEGEFQLVYAAPERLALPGFRALLGRLEIPLVAVDEAHCISEWGHDFRPEYMQIGELIESLPEARVLACTATATPVVRDEIVERLGLPADTAQLVQGFARPNLSLRVNEVAHRRERSAWVDRALGEALGAPGGGAGAAIIYAPTRRSAEEESQRLSAAGWGAVAYHAGQAGPVRDRTSREFALGQTELVVATNAFGMGIDRADVRAVIHLAPPSSIEAYYQEVGRAGRDGEPALGMLLLSPGDMALRRHFIDRGDGGQPVSAELREHRWGQFLELMRWAEGGSCRHDAILRYFDDEAETLAGCGHCDVCRALSAGGDADPEHVTLTVRKALSAVARVHGRFGLQMAAKLLKGTADERLARFGLDRTPTFGTLGQHTEGWLVRLLRRCVTAGWVDFSGGDRPVLVLTEPGAAVMRAERPARLLLPTDRREEAPARGPRRAARGPRGAAPRADDALDTRSQPLFEALRQKRLALAKTAGVPPYVVASDRALRDIARLRPQSVDQLLAAHGIGPAKAARYGGALLEVVAQSGDTALPG